MVVIMTAEAELIIVSKTISYLPYIHMTNPPTWMRYSMKKIEFAHATLVFLLKSYFSVLPSILTLVKLSFHPRYNTQRIQYYL